MRGSCRRRAAPAPARVGASRPAARAGSRQVIHHTWTTMKRAGAKVAGGPGLTHMPTLHRLRGRQLGKPQLQLCASGIWEKWLFVHELWGSPFLGVNSSGFGTFNLVMFCTGAFRLISLLTYLLNETTLSGN